MTARIVIAALLALAMRSIRLGLLSIVPNVVPLLGGVVFVHLMGRTLDIGGTVVASVCLGIAVDDTIHIITGYGMGKAKGLSSEAALLETLEHRGGALIKTTLILTATFSVFVFGEFVPNTMFGVLCAIVLGIALLADLTLLPLLLLIIDRSPLRSKHQQPAKLT